MASVADRRRPGLRDQARAASTWLQIDAPNGTPEARLGVEVRNALIFDLTSGGKPPRRRPIA